MITFKRENGIVTVVMPEHDYERLLMALGFASMSADRLVGRQEFYSIIRVVNELNAGNPNYTPYELPPEEPEREN